MRITNFDIYKDLLKEKSGLVITPDKSYLLESRLSSVAKKWGYVSVEVMSAALQGIGADPKLIIDVVEAMVSNETCFFRDSRSFQSFEDTVMPFFVKNRKAKRLKIWCAAASSGQEPYSLCLTLKEMAARIPGWNFDIAASDISQSILDQARAGIYSQFEVQRGLPIQMLLKYFDQRDDQWQLKAEILNMVQHEPFNLLDSMESMGQFDVIFCRNVLLSFDDSTRSDVLNRIHSGLEDDGFLFLGQTETMPEGVDGFKPAPNAPGLYTKEGRTHF